MKNLYLYTGFDQILCKAHKLKNKHIDRVTIEPFQEGLAGDDNAPPSNTPAAAETEPTWWRSGVLDSYRAKQ